MTIKEYIKKYGEGKYVMKTSEIVYVGSYGMGGYTKYTHFNLLVKNGNIYSESIYKTLSHDDNKKYITDFNEKIKEVNSLMQMDFNDENLKICTHKNFNEL